MLPTHGQVLRHADTVERGEFAALIVHMASADLRNKQLREHTQASLQMCDGDCEVRMVVRTYIHIDSTCLDHCLVEVIAGGVSAQLSRLVTSVV